MRSLLGRLKRTATRSISEQLATLTSSGDGSTLSLDFTAMGGTLDSRFTFTRSSTTSTYINSSGYVATAGTNVERFDYDPTTLTARGLLIEGSATNLLLYSQFAYTGSNPPTGWTSPFTGGPGSAATSTYGTLDGSNAWTQTASSNRPMLSSTAIALTSGNTYTVSMYLEAVSGGLAYQDVLLLNPSTATVGSPTYRRNGVTVNGGDTAQIGRIEATLSCTGSGNSNLRCGPGSNASCTGSATFSRPQVEVGTAASSFIPTSGSTVQRAADSCVMSGTNFSSWFNATQGTLLATWSGTGITSGRYATINDGSASNQIWLGYSESAIYNGSFQASFGTAGTANKKVALAYATNDAAWCFNGATVSTDTSVTLPTGLNQIAIGNSQAGTAAINTSLRFIKYFPSRLANTTLQSLTA